MAKQKHIVFTGGGTLGHVMPNLPLIAAYQKKGWKVSYIGSKKGEDEKGLKNAENQTLMDKMQGCERKT